MKSAKLVVLFAMLLSLNVYGQQAGSPSTVSLRTVLTGVVYDENGAVVVSDVRVVAHARNGKSYVTGTNTEGVYRIALPLDVYKVEASAPGFCPDRVGRFKIVNSTHGSMSLDFVVETSSSSGRCNRDSIRERKPDEGTRNRPMLIGE